MPDEDNKVRDCFHLKNDPKMHAITIIKHFVIQGAPTRADDLDTTTRLCALCSGTFASLLQQAEKVG